MKLIKYEFKKMRKANYFIGSFLAVLLSPALSLLLLSFHPRGFAIGDFNRMNLMLMSLIGSKVLFPLTGILLIKVEFDQGGWTGLFVTPQQRHKMLNIKIMVSILWSLMLLVFSVLVSLTTEMLLFNDVKVIGMMTQSISSYIHLFIYIIPHLIIGMMLSFLTKHTVIPVILLGITSVIGYFFQLFNKTLYIPSAIPEFISNHSVGQDVSSAYLMLYYIGGIALITFRLLFKNKDY